MSHTPADLGSGRAADPLYVDLDGSLLATDSLHEALVATWTRRPWLLPAMPFWVLQGKARFKARVAAAGPIDPSTLPYRDAVVTHLVAERQAGRRIVLATGAPEQVARRIADHLGLFDDVLATDDGVNLTGVNKLAAIERHAAGPFQYLGNSAVDLPIWRRASHAFTVAAPASVVETLDRESIATTPLAAGRAGGPAVWLRALRVHQWAKNLLMFTPAFTAHVIGQADVPLRLLIGFFAFSALASSIYLINDMVDLANDRSHPIKRHRPFAAGTLSVLQGAVLVPVLMAIAALLAFQLPREFQNFLAIYLGLTTAYSFWLKRVVALDTVVLASLYTIRIAAGGAAIAVTVSPWLFAFSMFFFLSLALVKRAGELVAMPPRGDENVKGRGYRRTDLEAVCSLGSASAYAAVVVLTLYINGSTEARTLYQRPGLLYLICPVVLYWVTRIWILARRGEVREDPVVFAITDRVSYAALAVMAAITLLAA
jgi:4-hydroxybenzoate polyprenyltransferase